MVEFKARLFTLDAIYRWCDLSWLASVSAFRHSFASILFLLNYIWTRSVYAMGLFPIMLCLSKFCCLYSWRCLKIGRRSWNHYLRIWNDIVNAVDDFFWTSIQTDLFEFFSTLILLQYLLRYLPRKKTCNSKKDIQKNRNKVDKIYTKNSDG